MRIGFTIYGSIETRSGGYLYDRKLVQALEQAGHDVRLISLPPGTWRSHLAHNFVRAHLDSHLITEADLYLQDELCHPSLVLMNRRLRRATSAPVVALVHHLRSDEPRTLRLNGLYRGIELAFLRTCDALLCNSQTTLASVSRLCRRPIESLQSLVAVPGGDHLTGVTHARPPRGGPLQALFVGSLLPHKRLHVLVAALALCKEPVTLTVVGSPSVDPAYAGKVQRLVGRLGLGHRVTFAGVLSDDALRDTYARAHVLAMPSFEGYGIVYLEAMAYGLPVIASMEGAAREVVTHSVDGFLVDPRDAGALASTLDALAGNPRQLELMGRAARSRFERQPTWSESGAAVAHWLPAVVRQPSNTI